MFLQKVQKKLSNKVDVAVLAKSTIESQKYAVDLLDQGIRVVDLSAAFRLKDVRIYEKTYGGWLTKRSHHRMS